MERKQTAEVATLLRVQGRVLTRWAKAGLLSPRRVRAAGRPWDWSEKDIAEAQQITALRAAGCSLQKVREVAKYLASLGFNPFSSGKVLVILSRQGKVEDMVKVVSEEEAFSLLKQRGQATMLMLDTPARGGRGGGKEEAAAAKKQD